MDDNKLYVSVPSVNPSANSTWHPMKKKTYQKKIN